MAVFLHAVGAVSIILLLTATGYFCGAKGWMTAQSKTFLSKFLLSLAVPFMCVYGLRGNLTREMIADSARLLAVPFACNAANFLLAFALARLLKLPRRRSGVFVVMCSISNAMFIGYPMCTELFGEACVPYVMLFYLANTCFTQTLAMWLIRRSGEAEKSGEKRSWTQSLRFLGSPTVVGLFIGVLLVWLDVTPPSFAMSYLRYMSGVVSPLALVLAGYIIYEMGPEAFRLDRDLALALLFRFVLSPGLYFLCCVALGVDGLARDTFLVEAAMPVVTQSVVAASQYGADERFAAEGAALSTVLSFLVIPVLMVLL